MHDFIHEWMDGLCIYIRVLFGITRVEEQLFDRTMEGGQALGCVCVWEVYGSIGSRRYDIELGVEDIYTIDNAVEPRHGEGTMALILAHSMLTAFYLFILKYTELKIIWTNSFVC